MSHLVQSLEKEDLIKTIAHATDTRRRVAFLTEAGRCEFDAYEEISNARASALLDRFPRVEELLCAIDIVGSAPGIGIEEVDPRDDYARYCLGEYYAELECRFEKGFNVSLSRNPDAIDMVRPRGAFLVAISDGLPIGCVFLKGTGGELAEIKRLWVSPTARGLGIARRLMHAAEAVARELSVKTLRLDTNRALPEALNMYRKSGWIEIDRFNDDPYAHHFFEKNL